MTVMSQVCALLDLIARDYGERYVPNVLPLLPEEWDTLAQEAEGDVRFTDPFGSFPGRDLLSIYHRGKDVRVISRGPFVPVSLDRGPAQPPAPPPPPPGAIQVDWNADGEHRQLNVSSYKELRALLAAAEALLLERNGPGGPHELYPERDHEARHTGLAAWTAPRTVYALNKKDPFPF